MADKTVKLDESNYSIALPLKNKKMSVPNHQQYALNLNRRCTRKALSHKVYTAVMNDLISSGYAERVPATDLERSDGKVWYIPHHGVYKKEKIWIFFDCGASFQGATFNAQLLQGPDFTRTSIGVLTRFRKEAIVLMPDTEAMVHQVQVPEEDVDLLRFLWWPSGDFSQCMEEYRMVFHLFGATSYPSFANFVLQKCTDQKDDRELFSHQVFETIMHRFYVDRCFASKASKQEAISRCADLRTHCDEEGFCLIVTVCLQQYTRRREQRRLNAWI